MFIHTADIQTPTDAISALPAVESTHIVITFIWEVIFSIEICVLYRSGASFFFWLEYHFSWDLWVRVKSLYPFPGSHILLFNM